MRLYRQTSSFTVGSGDDAKASADAVRRRVSQGVPGRPAAVSGVNVGRMWPLADRGPVDEPRRPYYRSDGVAPPGPGHVRRVAQGRRPTPYAGRP